MFLWNAANIDHIARHEVTPDEAEQAIQNNPFDAGNYLRNGEQRTNQIGETDAGRVLFLVTTLRGEDIRVVTAYPANRAQREAYIRFKERLNAESSEYS